jgi:hypothetical protein
MASNASEACENDASQNSFCLKNKDEDDENNELPAWNEVLRLKIHGEFIKNILELKEYSISTDPRRKELLLTQNTHLKNLITTINEWDKELGTSANILTTPDREVWKEGGNWSVKRDIPVPPYQYSEAKKTGMQKEVGNSSQMSLPTIHVKETWNGEGTVFGVGIGLLLSFFVAFLAFICGKIKFVN